MLHIDNMNFKLFNMNFKTAFQRVLYWTLIVTLCTVKSNIA